MCWPPGKAERRYAGVTHIDVTDLSESGVDSIHKTLQENGVEISGLGYYPNPLEADEANSRYYIEHLGLRAIFLGRTRRHPPAHFPDEPELVERIVRWGTRPDKLIRHCQIVLVFFGKPP